MLPVNAKIKVWNGPASTQTVCCSSPYAGYLIQGDDLDFEQAASDIEARKFQAGANIGIGFEILRLIQVGVNYRTQLTDNYAVDEPDWSDPLNGKSDSWSITAAIYF